MQRDTIFISYSRADSSGRDALVKHLEVVLGKPPRIRIFADTSIETGEEWRNRIRDEMDRSLVVVLLVSADFLTSEFVQSVEIPRAALAARRGEAVIACLYVRHCAAEAFRIHVDDPNGKGFDIRVTDYQGLNDPNSPLMALKGPKRERFLAQAARKIVGLAKERLKGATDDGRLMPAGPSVTDAEQSTEAKRKANKERKQREAEANRKAEEERKQQEAEAKRKAEEERKRAETEAKRKAEEKRQRAEAEAKRKDVEASEQIEVKPTSKATMQANLFKNLPTSFRNPLEFDAEYILIPGGRYKYQGKTEKEVPNIYFAKYPVTNKLYRRFIRYLEEKEQELLDILPKGEFDWRITKFASGIKDFVIYLGGRPNRWPKKLRSEYDSKKRFNSDDQPVVGVSWFATQVYCFWLFLLNAAYENLSIDNVRGLFRLPTEIEWEWAASGGKRKYPWAPEKGLPTDKLVNFSENVRSTTLVGRYPQSATPEGLMDMAGNVWEWMENWYGKDEDTRSLRGGSWVSHDFKLCCTGRWRLHPSDRDVAVGFRVVYSQ